MRKRHRRARLASAQELLPLDEIAGEVLRLRGGDYRAVLQAGSVNFALKSDAEQEAIIAGYRRFLNGLAYPLQVLVRVVPTDVEGYLAGLRGARHGHGRAAPARARSRGLRAPYRARADAARPPLLRGRARRDWTARSSARGSAGPGGAAGSRSGSGAT